MTPEEVWDAAISFVRAEEGGLSDDPRDPGGLTKFGISQRSYPHLDIRGLTREKAIDIYKTDFWDVHRCGELQPVIGMALFDACVNQGGAAVKLLQQALAVTADGVVGPQTIAAAARRESAQVLQSFLARRAVRYAGLSAFETYGLIWMGRLFRLFSRCLTLETPHV